MIDSGPRDLLIAQRVLIAERGENADSVMGLLGYERVPPREKLDEEERREPRGSEPSPSLESGPGGGSGGDPRDEAEQLHDRSFAWLRGRWGWVAAGVVGVVGAVTAAVVRFGALQTLAVLFAFALLAAYVAAILWYRRRRDGGSGIDEAEAQTVTGGGGAPVGAGGRPTGFSPERGSPRPDPELVVDLHARRGLGSALLSVLTETDAVDVDRLLIDLAKGDPVVEVPPKRGYTVAPGFTVLIDRGHTILPFLTDVSHLQQAIERQLPGLGRNVFSFDRFPGYGVGRSLLSLEPFSARHLPRRPGRVLVVTDFSIGQPRAGSGRVPPSRWVGFDDDLRSRGLSPLYLVPYPIARVPAELRDRLAIVRWDTALTARQIRRQGDRR